MYVMKPIREPEILEILNKGRFGGDIEGYILSDGGDLFGWSLFRTQDKVTHILDILAPDTSFLDGLIRASVAYGQARGAEYFTLNRDIPDLLKYRQVFFEDKGEKIACDDLFKPCHD